MSSPIHTARGTQPLAPLAPTPKSPVEAPISPATAPESPDEVAGSPPADQAQLEHQGNASALAELPFFIEDAFKNDTLEKLGESLSTSKVSAHMFQKITGTDLNGQFVPCESDYALERSEISALDAVRGRLIQAFGQSAPPQQLDDLLRIVAEAQQRPEAISSSDQELLSQFGLEMDDRGQLWMQGINGDRALMDDDARHTLLQDLDQITTVMAGTDQQTVLAESVYLKTLQDAMKELGILDALTAALQQTNAEVEALGTDLQQDVSLLEQANDFLARVKDPADLQPQDRELLQKLGIEERNGRFFQNRNGREARLRFADVCNIVKGRTLGLKHQIERKQTELTAKVEQLKVQYQEVAVQTERVEARREEVKQAYQAMSPEQQQRHQGTYQNFMDSSAAAIRLAKETMWTTENVLDLIGTLFTDLLSAFGNVGIVFADQLSNHQQPQSFAIDLPDITTPEPLAVSDLETSVPDVPLLQSQTKYEQQRLSEKQLAQKLDNQFVERHLKRQQKAAEEHLSKLAHEGTGIRLADIPLQD